MKLSTPFLSASHPRDAAVPWSRVAATLVLLACCAVPVTAGPKMRRTKHDMSVTGPGPTKASSERGLCVFCHTPHGGGKEAPLWNRPNSGATYVPYDSTTTKAVVGQPTGASKLCLSCHDGTVALGMVRSRSTPIRFIGQVVTMPQDRSATLRTDLADDHPISFVYDKDLHKAANGRLRDPADLTRAVRLDNNKMVQCTSCHDAHDDQYGMFLVMKNDKSALCTTCHDVPYWNTSIHSQSTATWTGRGPNPWPKSGRRTVANNGCANCHRTHTAGTKQRLLNLAKEEENCYQCHSGSVASKNVETAFRKMSSHNVSKATGVHDPTEDQVNPPRHVECFDCHNSHAVTTASARPPSVSGALAGVSGVDSGGSVVPVAANEYQVCYRCHADSVKRGAAHIDRQTHQTNVRLEFDPSNASFHPIEARGVNPDVPSLITPLTEASLIYCTDCHNNDSGPNAGGRGANGPHGSRWTPILERRLIQTDHSQENATTYALCYKCHSRTSILGNNSFPYHGKHLQVSKAACTTCHDPHGVSQRTHLINFNKRYVSASSASGLLEYTDNGDGSGSCSLTCHGRDHDDEDY
jgi:predicted CXXCH cytochrome family protein